MKKAILSMGAILICGIAFAYNDNELSLGTDGKIRYNTDTEERQRDYDRKTEDITKKQDEKERLEAIKADMISAGVDVAQAQVEQETVTATVGADE